MSIWNKLFTLGRAGAHEATAAVVDANALRILVTATDRRIETLRREVEVVKVNESVQKAQAAVSARGAGAGASLGSAADSLARIKERQMIRGERIKAAGELEDRRTGADLDEKLRLAGILPGQSSADDILARLAPAQPTLQIEQKPGDGGKTE
jgi:phage shock protein A